MTNSHLDGLPPAAQKLAREAYAALSRSALPQAERAITLMLAYAPAHAEPKRLLGMFLHRARRAREALVPLREALAMRPDDPDILIALAFAQGDTGDMYGAIASMRKAAELRPGADTLYMYGRALEQNAQLDEAVTMMRRALSIDPKYPTARLQLARDLFYTGHADEAATEFRRLIRDGRELAAAWYGLAEMKTVKFGAQDLAALKSLRKKPQFAGLERATLLHAVGKAFEDNDDYREAFDAFSEAGRIENALFPCDNQHFGAYVDSLRAAFPNPVERRDTAQGREAIFIVGMPRSGSTLIEQILAAHSQVEGASELPDLTLALDRESERRGSYFPTWVAQTSPQNWERIGAEYLASTARWRKEKPRFTDKSPGNWMQAEAAIAMLPDIRIVVCRRDPVEMCWSCFKQFFAPGRMAWGSSFEDIAYFWERCTIHCDYLAARYPQNVRIQSYEALLRDPEGQTRQLLEFCGLDFEETCLRFHEAQRTVRTASASQVRQPIAQLEKQSDRYGGLLDPLRESLERAKTNVERAKN
ncbi:MAG TPA: sulfotransferase [Rudaea sp.]|nr:sulfotransferase [Rudaea sp.]